MAKKTIRRNDNVVELEPRQNEILEYKLAISGAGANFAWAGPGGTILTHENFKSADTLVWHLKSQELPDGRVEVTVPQNPAYRRVENRFATPRFQLELAFVTAVKYTLTVRRLTSAGAETALPTDLDYAMEKPDESVPEGLFVGLGRA